MDDFYEFLEILAGLEFAEPDLLNPLPFVVAYAFLVGTVFGSLANVLAYRLPLGKSMVRPPSFCPSCEKRIKVYDLVPVLSYFYLRGKCRHCKARISPRYPIVEFLCGLLFGATALIYPFPVVIPFSLLALALLVITLIDIKVQEIPDSMLLLMVGAAVMWVMMDFESVTVSRVLVGAAAGAIPLFLLDRITLLVLKKDGFGYGDVKFMGAAGLFLGWQGVVAAYFIAFVSGAAVALYMLKSKKVEPGGYIAFGPFLCAGTLAATWSYAILEAHLVSFLL